MRIVIRAAILVTALGASAEARTWNVSPDGSGDAPTIQAAADSTSPGDVILLAPGTYYESARLPGDITLTSQAGAGQTTIDSEGVRAHCLDTAASVSNLVVEGITLTGMYYYGIDDCTSQAALLVQGSAEIRDCVFRDNVTPPFSAPLEIRGGSNVAVTGCGFLHNETGACGNTDPYDPASGAIYMNTGSVTVDGCTFEDDFGWEAAVVQALFFGSVDVRNCVIRSCGSLVAMFHAGQTPGVSFHVEGNLFVDDGAAFYPDFATNPFDLVDNTFARNGDMFTVTPAFAAGSLVRANVFTGMTVGLSLPGGGTDITVECNDSWGNGTDWQGFDPATGSGNFSADPLFCDPSADDFTVARNSPLLPANNSCGVQIGALGEGCGAISVAPETWGRIKSRYR